MIVMNKDDRFGFDMSVSTAKKNNPRGRRGMSGEFETSNRQCEHGGCQEPAKYRAPKSPDILDDEGTVKTKKEIRGITHMHHALDACVLAMASHYIPNNGRIWTQLVDGTMCTKYGQRDPYNMFSKMVC